MVPQTTTLVRVEHQLGQHQEVLHLRSVCGLWYVLTALLVRVTADACPNRKRAIAQTRATLYAVVVVSKLSSGLLRRMAPTRAKRFGTLHARKTTAR